MAAIDVRLKVLLSTITSDDAAAKEPKRYPEKLVQN
jgi:hypothetical protein